MLNLNTLCPSTWIYSAPGDEGQIVYFPKIHCIFRPRNLPGPKIFQAHGHSTIPRTGSHGSWTDLATESLQGVRHIPLQETSDVHT